MSTYIEDERAEQDTAEYDEYLALYGLPFLCLTCGERSKVDPHTAESQFCRVECGACGKTCLPEEEITPELAGILLCRRAGAVTIFKETQGHVWMYVRDAIGRSNT
jgi:hypothetical protein